MHYPPHITFAVFDQIEEGKLTSAVEALSSALSPVVVAFDRIRHFDTPSSIILWAAPADPSHLASIHRQLHGLFDRDHCRSNYLPEAWVAHSTLAVSVAPTKRREAMAFTEVKIATFEVVFDVIDCARFHPVEVIHETKLRVAV